MLKDVTMFIFKNEQICLCSSYWWRYLLTNTQLVSSFVGIYGYENKRNLAPAGLMGTFWMWA